MTMAKKKTGAAKRVSVAKVVAEESRYMMKTYRRPPVVFTHGRGCRLYDSEGRGYLDFLGGIAVNALGHAHPRMVKDDPARSGPRDARFELISQPVPGAARAQAGGVVGPGPRVFLQQRHRSNRGRDETARAYAHAAQRAAGQPKIRFLGAGEFVSRAHVWRAFRSLIPRNIGSHSRRWFPAWSLSASTMWRTWKRSLMSRSAPSPSSPYRAKAAFIPSARTFWKRARALATRQHSAALIADEIQCGLGRTGRAVRLPAIPIAARTSSSSPSRWPAVCRWEHSGQRGICCARLLPACTAPHSAAAR